MKFLISVRGFAISRLSHILKMWWRIPCIDYDFAREFAKINGMPENESNPVNRRAFLRSGAAVGAAVTLSASSYANVLGANERLGIAFIGAGARAQAHVHLIQKFQKEGQNLQPVAVCDVWDGHEDEFIQEFPVGNFTKRTYSQGLYPTARKLGLNPNDTQRVTKDYQRLLDLKEVDVVCIATPDHWHAAITLDAIQAGKDVYVERPLARTSAEAKSIVERAGNAGRVVTVGVQGVTDPSCQLAREAIQAGRIGPLVQASFAINRSDPRGMWRFYRVIPTMTAKTIDWPNWLGSGKSIEGKPIGPELQARPFDRTTFAQWRCDATFSGGPLTEWLYPTTVRFLAATGLQTPRRVMALGGLYQERDGRSIPDMVTITADYDEGCQLILTSTTLSNYPAEEVIRGRAGTLKFIKGGVQFFANESSLPARLEKSAAPHEVLVGNAPTNETQALWLDFLNKVRTRDRQTLCPPELGFAAVVLIEMATQSLHTGRVIIA